MQLRVSLAFASTSRQELDNFTLGVKDEITGNALTDAAGNDGQPGGGRVDFEQRIAKAASGGPPGTAAKTIRASLARRAAAARQLCADQLQ
jgi:hypothetical protein